MVGLEVVVEHAEDVLRAGLLQLLLLLQPSEQQPEHCGDRHALAERRGGGDDREEQRVLDLHVGEVAETQHLGALGLSVLVPQGGPSPFEAPFKAPLKAL